MKKLTLTLEFKPTTANTYDSVADALRNVAEVVEDYGVYMGNLFEVGQLRGTFRFEPPGDL